MAATISNRIPLRDWPYLIREVEVAAINPGASEDIAHGGPHGKKVDKVEVEVVVPSTNPASFSWAHDRTNDSTTNDTVRLKFNSGVGEDLAGMILKVRFHFFASAYGGIDAGNATP